MTTATSLSVAIARSISHDEIVHVDLRDALYILAHEAVDAGDLDTAQTINAILDPESDEVDPYLATRKALRGLIDQMIHAATSDHDDVDSVENGDEVEVWGVDEDGDTYRVHIQMRGLMDACSI
jgi:hypothetical protein